MGCCWVPILARPREVTVYVSPSSVVLVSHFATNTVFAMSDLGEPTQQTVFQAIEELLANGRFPNAKNIQEHLNCTSESVKISTHVKAWIRELGPSYRNVTLAALRAGAPSEDFGERVAILVQAFKEEFIARHGDLKRRETEVRKREHQLQLKEAALDELVARLGGWLCLEDRDESPRLL